MANQVKPYQDQASGKKEQVTKMFDTISTEYDGLNRMISLGLDQKWRANVVNRVAATKPQTILDVATGTGDLVIQMAEKTAAAKLIGLDISSGMLNVGKEKVIAKKLGARIEMVLGDSEKMPLEDNSIDAVTVSYGVRNFEDLEQGLAEILRVLRPGGTLVILETSVPSRFPFKQGYTLFTKLVVPTLGRLFSKDKVAYGYLSESASKFPYGEEFKAILTKVGFQKVEHELQFQGASTIYQGWKGN